jgi:hypothetical protein
LNPLRLQKRHGTHKLQLKFVSLAHSGGEIGLQSCNLRCVSSLGLRKLLERPCGLGGRLGQS